MPRFKLQLTAEDIRLSKSPSPTEFGLKQALMREAYKWGLGEPSHVYMGTKLSCVRFDSPERTIRAHVPHSKALQNFMDRIFTNKPCKPETFTLNYEVAQ